MMKQTKIAKIVTQNVELEVVEQPPPLAGREHGAHPGEREVGAQRLHARVGAGARRHG